MRPGFVTAIVIHCGVGRSSPLKQIDIAIDLGLPHQSSNARSAFLDKTIKRRRYGGAA